MKMKHILTLLLLLVIFFSQANAQFTSNGVVKKNSEIGYQLYWAGAMDTISTDSDDYDTLYSNRFLLESFEAYITMEISYLNASVLGAPKVTVKLLGSDFSPLIANAVVLATLVTQATTESETHTSQALLGIRAKYYWLEFTVVALSEDDTTFKFMLKFPARDHRGP